MPDPMPVGLEILTQTHFEAQSGPPPIKYSLDRNMIARGTISRLPDIALGNITTELPFGGANQFQCHYCLYQWNTHLEMMELDPHSH